MTEYTPVAQPQNPPAGWYRDPSGVTRWFDGVRWTEHVQATPAPPLSAPHMSPAVSHITHGGMTNGGHTKHLLLTVLTCGMWAPVWAISAWAARKRSSVHYR